MLTYGFYNSIGNDRRYNAEQMSSLFDGIINDGVFMSIGAKLIVSAATGMNIIVGSGRAWFNRTWTNNDAELVLMVSLSEVVLNRIDAVVLEVNSDSSVRINTIKLVKGTPSSFPVAPILINTEFVHQYALANIYVGAGVTSILAANITNKVGTGSCPFITGILDTVDIGTLLTQWDAQFNTWFSAVRDTLGNAIGFSVIKTSFTSIADNTTICSLGTSNFNPNMDLIFATYRGTSLTLDEQYTISTNALDVNLVGWSLKAGEKINFNILKVTSQITPGDGTLLANGSVYEIKMANEMKKDIVGGVASYDAVNAHKLDNAQYSTYKLSIDSNGIYTEVQHKRADATLILKSVLSGGTPPLYTMRTETKYLANGIAVEWTKMYTITYDVAGNVASEVMN